MFAMRESADGFQIIGRHVGHTQRIFDVEIFVRNPLLFHRHNAKPRFGVRQVLVFFMRIFAVVDDQERIVSNPGHAANAGVEGMAY